MNFWKELFSLRFGEESKEDVLDNIRSNISFKGANLWSLACAIVIASVGLNVNSTAVIIGAMLISPLMGPIVGAGFALGMFDFPLLKKSLLNLAIATIVGLTVSAVYFFMTPFKEAQSEILARTSPNIYDVLIAFFGGLVGVIALTRVQKGNPIPGVAIATALMPPLCTAGFGIATGNWTYCAGALFLYAINCTFICIATYIIVKFLNYPAVQIDERKEKYIHWGISTLIVIMVVPSTYFAYMLFGEQKFKQQVTAFISKEFETKGQAVIYRKIRYKTSPRKIELAFWAKKFNEEEITSLNALLPQYQLYNTQLVIIQDSTFLVDNRRKIEQEVKEQQLERNQVLLLQRELDNYRINTTNFFPEAKALFPKLKTVSVAKMQVFNDRDSLYFMPVVVYSDSTMLSSEERQQLKYWLKVKLNLSDLEVIRQ